jgi:hypothetical protein
MPAWNKPDLGTMINTSLQSHFQITPESLKSDMQNPVEWFYNSQLSLAEHINYIAYLVKTFAGNI